MGRNSLRIKIVRIIVAVLVIVLCVYSLKQASAAFSNETITIAIPYRIEKINPLSLKDPVNRIILANLGASLTRISKFGEEVPGLAENVKYNSNANENASTNHTWVVKIPSSVNFNNGEPLLAKDVKAALDYYKNEAEKLLSKSKNLPVDSHGTVTGFSMEVLNALANIESISVEEDTKRHWAAQPSSFELAIKLHKQDYAFGRILSTLPILNERINTQFGEHLGFGSQISFLGPYYLKENRANEGLTLEAVNNYFEIGRPKTKRLEFRFFNDAEKALSALRVGAVDIIAFPTQNIIGEVNNDPTIIVTESPLRNLENVTGSWVMPKQYWSKQTPGDRLLTRQIMVRRSLYLDKRALESFDLSGVYLP